MIPRLASLFHLLPSVVCLLFSFVSFAADPGYQNPGWYSSTPPQVEAGVRVAEFAEYDSGVSAASVSTNGADAVTPEIVELARGLDNDPVRIYEFVHNNIRYEPYYGSMKGATRTLLDRAGNDCDQASLLIALLRQSEYAACYAYGTLSVPLYPPSSGAPCGTNWVGAYDPVIAFVKGGIPVSVVNGGDTLNVDHFCVDVQISNAWVRLDPAIKVNGGNWPQSISALMGYDYRQLLTAAGGTATADYVQAVNEQAVRGYMTSLSSNFLASLKATMPNAALGEVMGVRKIEYELYTALPSALPWNFVCSWTNAAIPTNLEHRLVIQYGGITNTLAFHDIAHRKLTMKYDQLVVGGASITGALPRASLMLDDSVVATESGTLTGTVDNCTLTITHPYDGCNETRAYPFTRGALYAILCGFGDFGSGRLQASNQRNLEELRTRLPDTSPEVLIQSLHVMGQTWLDETALGKDILNPLWGQRPIWHHRVGIMAQETGYYVDVKSQIMNAYSDEEGNGYFDSLAMKASSLLDSSLEHAILEQSQGPGYAGVSTVKLLQMANANGDRIYQMTAANKDIVLAALTNYPSCDLTNFVNNTAVGLQNILPRNGAITAGQWVGNGYAVSGTLPNGQSVVGMIISGGYYGGIGCNPGVLNAFATASFQRNTVMTQWQSITPKSPDPVDLVSGAFLYNMQAWLIGGPVPAGLPLSLDYSSLDVNRMKSGQHGWTHNYDVSIEEHSSWQGGMGLRTPAEAVPIMVAAVVVSDMIAYEDNPKGWTIAALVCKWATDQLTTNAATVYMGNKALTFIHLPDGNYNPPPGVTMSLSKTNGLYVLSARNGREFRFNAALRLASIVDPDANTMTFSYNAATNLASVTDACDRSLTFNYSGASLTNVTASSGQAITLQGDSNANLAAFTDVAGNVWNYAYDSNHCMTATIEPGGTTNAFNTYDSLSRVQQQANGRELASQFLYSDFRTVEQDPGGNRRIYYFDTKQRETGRELIPGAIYLKAYDGQDHVIATQDPLGRVNFAFYDGSHNVTSTVNALSQTNVFTYDNLNRLVTVTDPIGHTINTEYDSQHHPIRMTDPLSNRIERAYQANGLLQRSVEIPSAAAGGGPARTNSWSYDSWRTPAEMFTPDGFRDVFSYNARGELLSHTDPLNNTTTYTYDSRSLLLTETDPLAAVSSNAWNSLGLLVSSTDKRGKTTTCAYSKTREVSSVTAPDGGVVSNVFDNADRVVAVINPQNGVTSNTWDSAGRKIAVRDPNGVTTRLTYDNVGNVLAVTDGLGNVTTNIYDLLNRPVETRSPNGAVTHTEYDAAGRVVAVVDALGRRTEFTLDSLGRKTTVKRPDNRFERYALDGFGNLLAFTNAAGKVQCFSYDSMGRKIGESNAAGTVRSYAFDAAGNLASKTDGNGKLTTFNYNAANRLTALHYADNSVVTFTNDPAGNLTGMDDPWGTTASVGTYENAGRLFAWTDHHNSTVQYRYDKAGAVTNINYPGNLTVTYGWDSAGRLSSVKDWASRTWTFSYDGANRLSGIQYPNGVAYSRGYNADGQLTNYAHAKSGTSFISRAIERNAAGLKTKETISAGLEVEQPDTWQTHKSDKADRLTGLTRRDEYVIPERWRGYTPSYNQEGQVTNVSETYRSWNSENGLLWNDAGRLVEYTGLRQTNLWTDTPPMPSWGLTLAYDGLGARTVRTDELVTHRLVVDRVGRLRVPLLETDESNTAIRYYIWAPGVGLLAQIEANSTIHYIHADENGSTLAMTDSNGNVTDQFAYSPWGELLGRTGTNTTSFTFVGGGGVTWEGGGLYRMGARYYDARLKRWLSADPAGMAGGANLYLYCNGNPLMWVDLLGLCSQAYFQNSLPDFMSSDAPVEEPGLVGGAVPLIGPMREAAANRMNGQYGWMAVNTAFAMADMVSLGRATVVRDALGAGIRETGEVMARDAFEGSVMNTAMSGSTRLWRAVEPEELADVVKYGDYNINPNSTFKRFAFDEGSLDNFIKANPGRDYTKTFIDVPAENLSQMYRHADPGGVGKAIGIDVYEKPQFYEWFNKVEVLGK